MRILLIDDDHIERMKFNRCIERLEEDHEVMEAENGEVALAKLRQGKHPQLILLDLNMPRLNGVEFLEILKNDDQLSHIPVVVLSTSSNDKDLKSCYKSGIAGYVIKPLKYEDYTKKIEIIIAYWNTNELLRG